MDDESIFAEALEHKSPAERAAYLAETCQGDLQLRQRVEGLLRSHEAAGRFLDEPAISAAPHEHDTHFLPDTPIGPYRLLEQIGEGGMGIVWMAEQREPLRRIVALKVIKPGMDTRQVLARFEAERQALSLMDHPHIATVLDAGTTGSGHPYFVMEFVRGQPITAYCDEHGLTPRQRLELFLPVCQAIQHAHQKGIIHRDIKPSNVLVAEYDQQAVPKVIDFGVAKAISQPLMEKTLFRDDGHLVGTLEYMSPEQAQRGATDIDTRSDVYSLGIVLYELLTGTTPFDRQRLQSTPIDEQLRIIREEEPPPPSSKLSHRAPLPTVGARRNAVPARLSALCRGELDWIVMKALEKDRRQRYDSASDFAADVQRYLRDEPVLAGPPSRLYRLRKLVRRHTVPVLATTLVFAALVAGIVGVTWGLLRARAAGLAEARRAEGEKQARQAAEKAEVNERQQRRTAEANAQEARRQFLKAREAVKAIVGVLPSYSDGFVLVTYRNGDDVDFVPGVFGKAWVQLTQDKQKDLLDKALQFYEGFLAQDELDLELRVEVALACLHRAALTEEPNVKDSRENDKAETAYRQALTILTRVADDEPSHPEAWRLLARGCERLAGLLSRSPRRDEAEQLYARAIAMEGRLIAEFPTEAPYYLDRAATLYNWGTLLRRLKRPEEALPAYRQSQRDFEKYISLIAEKQRFESYAGCVCRSLGNLLTDLNRPAEAETAYRQALEYFAREEGDDDRASIRVRLGQSLLRKGQTADAEREFRAALADYERLVKTDSMNRFTNARASLLAELARLVHDQPDRLAEARELVQRAIQVTQQGLARDPMDARLKRLLDDLFDLQRDLADLSVAPIERLLVAFAPCELPFALALAPPLPSIFA